jgi:hypothetical protein
VVGYGFWHLLFLSWATMPVIQHDSVVNFMLIGKTQITFPLVRFALKRAIMLHSVTSYKLIVASVVRKTGEPWGPAFVNLSLVPVLNPHFL